MTSCILGDVSSSAISKISGNVSSSAISRSFFSDRKSSTSSSGQQKTHFHMKFRILQEKVAPTFFLSLPQQKFTVVVVIGAAAAEVRTHFHFQIRIPPARLVTAALPFYRATAGRGVTAGPSNVLVKLWAEHVHSLFHDALSRMHLRGQLVTQPYHRVTVDRACPQSVTFTNFNNELATRFYESAFCRNPRGPSFTNFLGERARGLFEIGFCRKPKKPSFHSELARRPFEIGYGRNPKRPSFTKCHQELPKKLFEIGFCRDPRRPSFTNFHGELAKRLVDFACCCGPVLHAPRKPRFRVFLLAELSLQNSDRTRKPIYGVTQLRIAITGSSLLEVTSSTLNLPSSSSQKMKSPFNGTQAIWIRGPVRGNKSQTFTKIHLAITFDLSLELILTR